MKNILFIFHDSELTGANLVLYRYVNELVKLKEYKLSFIVGRQGALITNLSRLGPVTIAYVNTTPGLLKRIYNKLARIKNTTVSWKHLEVFVHEQQPDIIYCNTILSVPFIKEVFSKTTHKIVLHLHELELAYNVIKIDISSVLPRIAFFIANSAATASFIRTKFKISNDKIAVHYPVLPEMETNAVAADIPGLHAGRFIIGSSGTGLSRKGVFVFVQLAAAIKKKMGSDPFQFIWVGNIKSNEEELRYDVKKAGLEQEVLFTGESHTPLNYYKQFDVFVSVSKEESFGLACAEAAALGVPLIGFKGTGGGEELIQSTGGILVPYLDIEAMAESIIQLKNDNSKLQTMKEQAKNGVKPFFSNAIVPAWENTIHLLMQQSI